MNFKILKPTLLLVFLFSTTISAQEKKTKKIDSIARVYSDKAYSFIRSESDSALFYANKGITYAKDNNSKKGEIFNLEVKATYQERVLNNYKEATKTFLEAITLAEVHYKDFLPMLYSGLSNLYVGIEDYNRALGYSKKAVTFSKKNSRMKSGTMLNLGILLSNMDKYDEANNIFKTLLKNNKLDSAYGVILINSSIGSNLSKQKKYKEAIIYHKIAVETDSLNGNFGFRKQYKNIIDNFIEINNKPEVIKFLPIFIKSYKNRKVLNDKRSYYSTYSNALQFLGDYKNAIIYKDSLIDINQKLQEKKYNKGIVEADTKYQTVKKDAQIKSEKGKQKLWLLLASLSFLTLLIVAFSLYKNNQKRKELSKSKKSLEIALNQRNMLLKETHHRVKNSFQMVSSLLKLQARGTKAIGAVTALDNAVQRVNSMIILHQQLYAKDNILGINLKIYIKDLITEITRSYDTKQVIIIQNIADVNTDIDTATSIGLLINELATNSLKHAWAKKSEDKVITIQIKKTKETLLFKMFDNGIHKQDNPVKTGYGSELITILIKRLKASKLVSETNNFAIHLEIPIQKNEA